MRFTNSLLVLSGVLTFSLAQENPWVTWANGLASSINNNIPSAPSDAPGSNSKCNWQNCGSGVCINDVCQGGIGGTVCKDGVCVTASAPYPSGATPTTPGATPTTPGAGAGAGAGAGSNAGAGATPPAPTNAEFKCGGKSCGSGVCINNVCQASGGIDSVSCKDDKCVTVSSSCDTNGVCSTKTLGSASAPTMNPMQAAVAGIAGFMAVALAL